MANKNKNMQGIIISQWLLGKILDSCQKIVTRAVNSFLKYKFLTKNRFCFSGLLCSDPGASGLSEWSCQLPLWLWCTTATASRGRQAFELLPPYGKGLHSLILTSWMTQIHCNWTDVINSLSVSGIAHHLTQWPFQWCTPRTEFRWEADNPWTQVIPPLGIYLKEMIQRGKCVDSKHSLSFHIIYDKLLAEMGENQNI